MGRTRILTDAEIKKGHTESVMETVAWMAGYYRANPHRFCEEYLGIHLKLFQKIVLFMMMWCDNTMFISSRGLGKTYLVALFSVVRSILFPGSKIVITSATVKQAKEVILKVTEDLMQKSPLLKSEISKWSTSVNDTYITFKNGSWMRVYVANENARGARANLMIVDESRLISQKIIDTIFVPMLSAPRQPGYLSNPKYAHLQEMNQQIYLSSAYYQSSELYDKAKSYFANSLNDKLKYFICDLPYELAIKEGLLMRQSIENEMSEATFSDITFAMEREGIFWGAGADSLFQFKDLNNRRIIKDSLHDLEYYRVINVPIPKKQIGELRILSLDIALLSSKKRDNDASCFIITSAMPTADNSYISNEVYITTREDIVTDELGLLTMRMFYQYDCDYLAIDANGVGQSVLDYIMTNRFDPEYGVTYGALNVCNNNILAERCKVKNAPKVVYAFKATAQLNNDWCLNLRAGIMNGNINLLINDVDVDDYLYDSIKGYNKLTDIQKAKLRLPYLQTTLLIDELINLEHDESNGLIRVHEKSGMRKDRYSSLLYGYAVVTDLIRNNRPRDVMSPNEMSKIFYIRPPVLRRSD